MEKGADGSKGAGEVEVIGGDEADGDRGGVEAGAADPALGMMEVGNGGEEIVGEVGADGVAGGVAGGGELIE